MSQKDLADKAFWDHAYGSKSHSLSIGWKPKLYESLSIEHILLTEIKRYRPKTILEVGCGNSQWLAYLARVENVNVSGIDYSEKGCELAAKRLEINDINGIIFCEDFFNIDLKMIGRYDFVYSLGVIEHYSDPYEVIDKLMAFVKPGGVLLTEVPNLDRSIHGLLMKVWQPSIFYKHKPLSKDELINIHKKLGLVNVRGYYIGLFSLGLVSWGDHPRWPILAKWLSPIFNSIAIFISLVMSTPKIYRGYPKLAPFIYTVGQKVI